MWLDSKNGLEPAFFYSFQHFSVLLSTLLLCSFPLRTCFLCSPGSIWNMEIHSSPIYVITQPSRERLTLSLLVPILKLRGKKLASFRQLSLPKWINPHQGVGSREKVSFLIQPTHCGLGLWTWWTEWWPWSYRGRSGALKSGSCCKRLFLQSDDRSCWFNHLL